MAVRLENPVQKLLARLEGQEQRVLIALAGMPGSGKSTLAAHLEAAINAEAGEGTLVALGMDGFHLTKAQLRAMPDPEQALIRRGAPWTFDAPGLAARLQALREAAGRDSVSWPGFEHGVGDPVEDAQSVGPNVRLVLVEGLYLLHRADGWDAVSQLFDERWYLDTSVELAMSRLAERHMASWGLTRAVAEARIARNDGLNAEIVRSTREFSDYLLD